MLPQQLTESFTAFACAPTISLNNANHVSKTAIQALLENSVALLLDGSSDQCRFRHAQDTRRQPQAGLELRIKTHALNHITPPTAGDCSTVDREVYDNSYVASDRA